MAGKKLKAGTLVEVLVAMVIIVSVFVTGSIVFSNILKSGISNKEAKAVSAVDQTFARTVQKRTYFDEVSEEEDMVLTKEVLPYGDGSELIILKISVLDDEKVLYSRRQILYAETE